LQFKPFYHSDLKESLKSIVVKEEPANEGGLLGLNYLERFQMDLRPEEGTLLLIPQ
jgi:hypothetical protein